MEKKRQKQYKQKITLSQLYFGLVYGIRSFILLGFSKRKKLISNEFIERLMLAVTEVNGCEVCSYAHTKMALQGGFTTQEINAFLSGDPAYIKPEESVGILFAQHYTDYKGYPLPSTVATLQKTYGKQKARIILAAIQTITLGNVIGIPISAFISRCKHHPYQNSSLSYELGMMILGFMFFSPALIHTFISTCLRRPPLHLSKE
ncbi:MAG: carboxymuconolactone decarboxylase family protein [Bacilli bacterium]